MIGIKDPAPLNLKKLHVCLLTVTLTIGTISLVSMLRIGHSLDGLAKTYYPGLAWIDEMTVQLGQAQSSFHRSTNSPVYVIESGAHLVKLSAELGKPSLPFAPSFSTAYIDGVARFAGLSQLAVSTRELGRWEDLQVIMRDVDQSSDQLSTLLQEERQRLYEVLTLKRGAVSRTLRITEVLLILSLVISALIAVGFYVNWRRLERSVLGLE